MLVNLEGAKVVNHHGHHSLVLNLEKQFEDKDVQSLNVQDLFAKQQNPSFLAYDEEDLQNLSNAGHAKDKHSSLWSKIAADKTPSKFPSPGGIFLISMDKSFDTAGDVMPSGRAKFIHAVGATGKVKFVHKGGKYTGIFQGADYGLIRLSSAAEPSDSQPLAPCMGLKFLRDGVILPTLYPCMASTAHPMTGTSSQKTSPTILDQPKVSHRTSLQPNSLP